MNDLSPERMQDRPRLGCMIDPDLDNLNSLHKQFNWLPNSERIRPDEQLIILKRRKLQEIELNWESFTDYILHTAFSRKLAEPTNRGRLPDLGSSELGTKPTLRNSRLVKRSIQDGTLYDGSNDEVLQCAFVPNPFPYNLIDGHHWTLWYNSSTQPHCDDMITEDIQKKIIAELGPTAPFDFAWYLNPKLTVPEIFHVQVFWTEKSPS